MLKEWEDTPKQNSISKRIENIKFSLHVDR